MHTIVDTKLTFENNTIFDGTITFISKFFGALSLGVWTPCSWMVSWLPTTGNFAESTGEKP